MSILSTTTAKLIIQEALELLGALGEGELANSDQETSLLRTLNTLAVTWQADGLNLFSVTKLNLFLTKSQQQYVIPSSGVHIATAYDTSRTTAAHLAGDTILAIDPPVDTTYTNVKVGSFWTTTFANTGDSITLNDPLPEDIPASTAVTIYPDYTATKPMKILDGTLLQFTGNSIPMSQLSRTEYDTLSRKDPTGIPLQFYYDPQTTYGTVFVWPTASSEDQVLELYVQRQLETAVNVANEVEYPAEWFLPLATNLAYVSSAKYGLPRDDHRRLETMADKYYTMAKEFDFEWGTSISFAPDYRGVSNSA